MRGLCYMNRNVVSLGYLLKQLMLFFLAKTVYPILTSQPLTTSYHKVFLSLHSCWSNALESLIKL